MPARRVAARDVADAEADHLIFAECRRVKISEFDGDD
jgi:hypothetical protein